MAEAQTSGLGRLIEGRSEQEITAEVQQQGVDTVLGEVFSMIAGAFIPDAPAIEHAIVQFDVAAPDGIHSYQLKFADRKCVVMKADGEAARLSVSVGLPDFLRIFAGALDGMEAFVSGRVHLSGDVLLAQAMPSWFGR